MSRIHELRDRIKARAREKAARRSYSSDFSTLRHSMREVEAPKPDTAYEGYEQTAGQVRATAEFDRVTDLPREHWEDDPELDELVAELTAWLRKPNGEMELWRVQAAALQTIYDNDGMIGAIGVGKGKTLITYLAGTVVGAKRVMVVINAELREKTERNFAELSKHWICNYELEFVHYEKLSRETGIDTLLEFHPDLIVCDEVHAFRNLNAACTRTMRRYLAFRQSEGNPVKFVGVSGTLTSRSIKDYAHLLQWALGKSEAPVPVTNEEMQEWSRAIDEKLTCRTHPGALRRWLPSNTPCNLSTVRRAVRDRIASTPGVMYTTESDVDASILITTWDPKLDPRLERLIDTLLKDKVLPNGDEVALPSDVWRHVREMVCGFYYLWDPQPPEEWLKARKSWRAFVRARVLEDIPGLDSEMMIARACLDGRLSDRKYLRWKEIQSDYKIRSVPVWVNDGTLRQALDRIKHPTLVWSEFTAAAHRFCEISGFPYYYRKGFDKDGNYIEDLDPSRSAVLSVKSNKQGRNLQAWSHNSILTPPPNGALMEQIMARTHREKQEADRVCYDIAMGHQKLYEALEQAFADARYIEDGQGQKQKLLLADVVGSAFK